MNAPEVITIDFETLPIQQRPHYPPKPVGVAIKWPEESKALYFAWGHPTGNTCDVSYAQEQLGRALYSNLPLLFHHAKFDLAVLYECMGWPEVPWHHVHDTMFLAYLCDPHAPKLGLKDLAADLLQWPADEQDELHGWILAHKAELEATYQQYGKVTKRTAGAWIFAAPGDLVGRYAVGDVGRTAALFKHLWPIVQENGMGAAYDRERQLLPILMENEERGLRVDLDRLAQDITGYEWHMETAETWLRTELRASGLNFDADRDVASVLLERGVVPQDKWSLTKSGQLSTSKDSLLPEYFTDPRIASALGYRNRLKTCLEMFMKPWASQASINKGYVTTNWNQTRGDRGGTRTGRPSTANPNFLNISKDFEGRSDGYIHPAHLPVQVRPLPLVRKYILPDEGEVFLHRDFDGQELRVFAHYENGALWQAYQENAALDPHSFVGNELERVAGFAFERTKIKVLNFQSLYGGGAPAAAKGIKCSLAEAKQFKAFHDRALPGRKILNEEITRLVRRGEPIRTWGGRLYYPEKPGPDGRDKVYKLINYAVQGSAADLTKQSLIEWHSAAGRSARFLVTVYDEINITALPDTADGQMALLRDVMEARRLTVPMRSSGKRGPTWGDLEKCA